jgi:hypothetical protein
MKLFNSLKHMFNDFRQKLDFSYMTNALILGRVRYAFAPYRGSSSMARSGPAGRWLKSKAGQSMVETAIAMPLLILMFLGVLEVGWALRGYLVLANVNRESVRFAVKTGTLDFSQTDPVAIGYGFVMSHTMASLANQLDLHFDGPETNATMILSHFVIDTGLPCATFSGGTYVFDTNCDCTTGIPADPDGDGTPWFSLDDLVIHPATPGYAHYAQTYGISDTTRLSDGDYAVEAEKLKLENNRLNCVVLKTGVAAEMTSNNLIVAEVFHKQPQLLGAPLVSNPLTDPIPLYSHTAMRIAVSRDAETTDTVGPVCELAPFAFQYTGTGSLPVTLSMCQAGGGCTNFKWLAWDETKANNSDYLAYALENHRLSINDYTNGSDQLLNLGDPIEQFTAAPNATINPKLDALLNATIQVPIIDGSGEMTDIALISVSNIDSTARTFTANLLEFRPEACQN